MRTLLALAFAVVPNLLVAQAAQPAPQRPFLMPAAERVRILEAVAGEPWAREEMARVEREAAKDGYAAALVYVLKGGEAPLAVARRWLLDYAAKGGDIPMAKEKLGDPEFFRGGQPWIGPVYYHVDIRPLVAYDWIHGGLTPAERSAIEAGILTSARFRRKCMDRWTQTPNLVFKPTVMVALAGLVTQDRELLAWGFLRKAGSPIGGYFPVLDAMLDRDGPWREAPIYPVAHQTLELMATMSRLLALQDPGDPFARLAAGGGSPQRLMDSYLATAYPPETAAGGGRRIRVLTYGDGATSAAGDLFLVGARPKGDLSLREALTVSWSASRDPRYAALLALDGGYRPALPDRPPLPTGAALPPAPSTLWRSFGLAFLRSDESPGYWRSGDALAASLMMSRGYGHDHRDKLGITFFGAGRLLYPDWNHEQYENPAIGWTRNTIAHNALMVDEEDARDAEPLVVTSDFTGDARRVYVEAEGVFEGVRQGRALVLTKRYLLDVVSARSGYPRTYDYLLHVAAGRAAAAEGRFEPAPALGPRYARLRQEASATTDGAWTQPFAAGDAGVRLTMAAAPGTQVVTGVGHDGNAMLVARRDGRQETAFVAVHEPLGAGAAPAVRAVTIVGRGGGELVVRVEGDGWREEHRVPSVSTAPAAAAPPSQVELRTREVRVAAGGQATLDLVVVNRGTAPLTGTIDFALPAGVAIEPARIAVGPLPAGGEARRTATLRAASSSRGRASGSARLRTADGAAPLAEAAVRVAIGPTLWSDYRTSATPLYRVEAPALRAALDMRHGMVRHLADDDGRDRLGGRPLFTLSAGGRPLLAEATEKAFTWPTEAPAELLAEVENAARYRLRFLDDRLVMRMDAGWTRAERVEVHLPGAWAAGVQPRWAARDEAGGRLAGAELAFPDGNWSLCFAFSPPQPVAIDGSGLRFEIGGANGDAWSAGFCRPGELASWRRNGPPSAGD